MSKRVLIIDGHPDPGKERFIHALSIAYRQAAESAGHKVRLVQLANLEFPLLRSNEDFLKGEPPEAIRKAQADIAWSNHLVIFFPLWLGATPALLKGFLEQVMRPGFAFKAEEGGKFPTKLLTGKSARIVVTMGMPAFFYRWYFRAHSLKSLERNILGFVGVKPIRASIVGSVEAMGAAKREVWLKRMRQYARQAQ